MSILRNIVAAAPPGPGPDQDRGRGRRRARPVPPGLRRHDGRAARLADLLVPPLGVVRARDHRCR